jgi:hypothetical protein
MAIWQIGRGGSIREQVTIRDGDGDPITTYAGTETLAAKVWPGQNLPALCTPTVEWDDPSEGTILVTIDADDSADLETGLYFVRVTLTDGDGATFEIYRGHLDVASSPDESEDAETPSLPVYCSFHDLLMYASWIEDLQKQDPDAGLAGFLRERARARAWLDEIIVNRWKLSNQSLTIGQPGWMPQNIFGGQDTIPNKWLKDRLADGKLVVTERVKEIVCKKAISYICEPQIGGRGDMPYSLLAARFARAAESMLTGLRAEIDLSDTGWASIVVNLGASSLR